MLRFVPADSATSVAPNHGLKAQRWYPNFIAGLRAVGETGTAAGTGSIVRRALGSSVVFLGKTGTLNSPASSWRKQPDPTMANGHSSAHPGAVTTVDPVVATTLVFAVGEHAEERRSGR